MLPANNLLSRITIQAGVRSGKPVVRGTRITVGDVLGQLGAGMSVEELLEDYPNLKPEDVQACMIWAARREAGEATLLGDYGA